MGVLHIKLNDLLDHNISPVSLKTVVTLIYEVPDGTHENAKGPLQKSRVESVIGCFLKSCSGISLSVILSVPSQHDRIAGEETPMVKSRHQIARKPATRFSNLQKKKQNPQAKKTGKKI